ncbi:MAG: acetylornithine transaminase [Chloroflexi bacterium]|nr:acetylornithine transaminase [Chloroflexota bacterium]
MGTYRRYPLVIERGEGCRVWDVDGRRYLDFLGGLAVDSLGHAPQVLVDAVAAQAGRLIQTSNLLYTIPQVELAEFLVARSPFDRVFFSNSGAEANEAAFKLARKWGKRERGGAYRIIAADNSFHGRTLATVAATGNAAYRTPFEPLPDGFDFVAFNDVDALADAVTEETAGVILEPIQAEGGVNLPSASYLADVRALCDERKIMLIFDEVQTGVGRTGSLWAHTHWGVEPDVMTLAKGLAGGFPIGATLAKEPFCVFEPGDHASTFGGNPLACATALAVQQEIERKDLPGHAASVGQYFMDRLTDLSTKHPQIKEVRGRGLLVALEFHEEIARQVLDAVRDAGLIANALNPRTLRFVPPLIVTQAEVDEAVDILDQVLTGKASALAP